tara:strand:- start:593 stop:1381 length:789 start_codon:yes stop_codon:yes gene_type:complete
MSLTKVSQDAYTQGLTNTLLNLDISDSVKIAAYKIALDTTDALLGAGGIAATAYGAKKLKDHMDEVPQDGLSGAQMAGVGAGGLLGAYGHLQAERTSPKVQEAMRAFNRFFSRMGSNQKNIDRLEALKEIPRLDYQNTIISDPGKHVYISDERGMFEPKGKKVKDLLEFRKKLYERGRLARGGLERWANTSINELNEVLLNTGAAAKRDQAIKELTDKQRLFEGRIGRGNTLRRAGLIGLTALAGGYGTKKLLDSYNRRSTD